MKDASFKDLKIIKDIITNKIEDYERNPILNKNNFNNCLWKSSPSTMVKDIIYQIVSFNFMAGNLNTNKLF